MSRISRALAFAALLITGACSKVPPGYVGILVSTTGTQKNAADFPIMRGRVWFNPVTSDLYSFPTFLQNVTWTASEHEGKAVDESITFNSIEGATINADIALAYTFQAEKVPEIFLRFRRPAEAITDGYMRNKVRAAFSAEASNIKVQEIYGAGKQTFLAGVRKRLTDELGPEGFQIDMIDFIGNPRLPANVAAAINNSLQATQDAQTAENQLRKTQAVAAMAIAKAEGESKANIITAEGEARANAARVQTLTTGILRQQAISKWNGVLPQVSGGSNQMLQLILQGAEEK